MNNRFPKLSRKKGEKGKSKKISLQYLLILLALGVALMLFGNIFSSAGGSPDEKKTAPASKQKSAKQSETVFGNKDSSNPSTVSEYEHYYENQLKEAIEDVYGVSDVTVKVNVSTSKTKIIGKDRNVNSQTTNETDQQGGNRKIEERSDDSNVVTTNGSDGDKALVVGTEEPKIGGVLVVAGGADHAQVKLWIKEAVNSLLGVPDYRISVLPKKMKGE